MNTYTLQFDTKDALAGFIKTSGAKCSLFDLPNLTITCELSDAQIELATSAYDASILLSANRISTD